MVVRLFERALRSVISYGEIGKVREDSPDSTTVQSANRSRSEFPGLAASREPILVAPIRVSTREVRGSGKNSIRTASFSKVDKCKLC
jgi:hypothetical protein